MKYKLPIVVTPLEDGGFMARCDQLRATATGDTPQEAVENLREAIAEMVREYGEEAVFQGVVPDCEVQVIEVAV